MSEDINYDAVEVPSGKPPEEYTYPERRAAILDRMEQAAHPRALVQKDLADEFGTSPTSIHRDFEALAEYVGENLARDHSFVMDRVFHGAVLNLVEDDEHAEAARVGKLWYEWLADMGVVDRAARGLNVDATIREASDSSDDYVVVEDEDDELDGTREVELVEAEEHEPELDAGGGET